MFNICGAIDRQTMCCMYTYKIQHARGADSQPPPPSGPVIVVYLCWIDKMGKGFFRIDRKTKYARARDILSALDFWVVMQVGLRNPVGDMQNLDH